MADNQTTKRRPTWFDAAKVYASRSGIKTFSTGAIILDSKGRVVSQGWSHYSEFRLTNYRSIHAEVHAIFNAKLKAHLNGATIYVVTIRNKSGNIGLGKPCDTCLAYLYEVGMRHVYYTVDGADFDYMNLWG